MQAAQVRFLVGELRSHVQGGQEVKERKRMCGLTELEMPREQGGYCFRGVCEGACKVCEIRPPKVGRHWEVNWE